MLLVLKAMAWQWQWQWQLVLPCYQYMYLVLYIVYWNSFICKPTLCISVWCYTLNLCFAIPLCIYVYGTKYLDVALLYRGAWLINTFGKKKLQLMWKYYSTYKWSSEWYECHAKARLALAAAARHFAICEGNKGWAVAKDFLPVFNSCPCSSLLIISVLAMKRKFLAPA